MDLRTALKAVSAAVITKPSPVHENDTLTEAVKKVLVSKPAGASIEDILAEMVNPRYDYKAISLVLRTREAEGLIVSRVQPGTMLRMKYFWKTAQKETTNEKQANDEMEGIVEMNVKEETVLRLQEIYPNGRKFGLTDVADLLKEEFADELRRLRKSATAMAGEIVTKITSAKTAKASGKGDKTQFSFIEIKTKTEKEEVSVTTETTVTDAAAESKFVSMSPEVTKLALDYKNNPKLSQRGLCWVLVVMAGGEALRGDIMSELLDAGVDKDAAGKAFSNALSQGYIRITNRDPAKRELDIVGMGSIIPPIPRGSELPNPTTMSGVPDDSAATTPVGVNTDVNDLRAQDIPSMYPELTPALMKELEEKALVHNAEQATPPVEEVVVSKEITARLSYHGTEVVISGMPADVAKAIREMMK